MIECFDKYGLIVIFIIMYLEGLNLTGIPAIVILPTIGAFSANSVYPLMIVVGITILASLLGNLTYYIVIRCLGGKIYDWIYNKFAGMRKSLDKAQVLSDRYGNGLCLVGRLIPGVRTVVSLVAGTFRVQPIIFIIFSALGILVWNLVLIYMGYIVF